MGDGWAGCRLGAELATNEAPLDGAADLDGDALRGADCLEGAAGTGPCDLDGVEDPGRDRPLLGFSRAGKLAKDPELLLLLELLTGAGRGAAGACGVGRKDDG